MIRKLWFDEKPKASGYYWFKYPDCSMVRPGEVVIVHVKRGRAHFFIEGVSTVPVKMRECPNGKWSAPIPFPQMRVVNKHESGLKDLTLAVIDCLAALDYVMRQRESPERGSMVAKIANHLNFANDSAMHMALGMSFQEMEALKRKRERERIKARKAQANGR